MNYRRQLSSSQAASSAASSSSSEPPSFSSVSVSTPVTSLTSTSVSASLPPQQASSAGPSTAKQVDSSTTKKPAASSTPDEPADPSTTPDKPTTTPKDTSTTPEKPASSATTKPPSNPPTTTKKPASSTTKPPSDPPTTTKKSTTTKPPADTSNTPDPPSSTTTKPPTDTSDTPDPPNSSAGSTANPPPSTSRKLTTTSASSAASAAQSAQPPRATSDSPAAQSSGVNRDEDNAASVSISVSASGPGPSSSAPPPKSEVSSASDPGPSQSQSQSQSKSQPASESQSASSDPPDSSTPASSASQSDSSASLSESASASASDSASLPLPSSSDSGIPSTLLANNTVSADLSTLLTTFTTEINGQLTTVTSAINPTSLSTSRSSINSVQRTAIIAGATAAGVGILLLCLGAVFLYKRHKSRKREFSEALGRFRRETQGAGGVGLLDDEFDDDDDNVPMRRYRDAVGHSPSQSRDLNMSSTSLGPPQSPAPSLFRQRAETGSLFREEGVWPPPGSNFVDPLVGLGAGDGLTRIVDDVMGPAPSSAHARDSPSGASSSSTAYSGLGVLNTNADGTPRDRPHTASMSSMYNDPFRDVSLNPPPYDPSQYYDRSGSSLSTHSQQTSGGSTGSGDRSPTPQSLLGLPAGAAAPKKSSPLVNMSAKAASPTPSPPPPTLPSAGTWLTRSPRKQAIRLSGEESTG